MSLDARLLVQRNAGFQLDASLTVEPGETVALLGPNGAGKSTAVSALAGIVPLDSGHVTLDGRVLDDPARDVFVPPEDRHVGVVFQDYLLFPHMSVIDNVVFALRNQRSSKTPARESAARWLDRLGLGELARHKPNELSGGEAQRVALARTLATEPRLLLLDEPLAALDVTTRTSLRRSLANHLGAYSGPRLLITHDPTDAFILADRVVVVENGTMIQQGTPDELLRHPQSAYVADLVGVNLVTGTATNGRVTTDGPVVQIADTSVTGDVLLTIRPRSISVHTEPPGGSPRNTWQTTIAVIEPLGDRIRLQLGAPQPLTAELTATAGTALNLAPGSTVWVAIKATEIAVHPG